MPPPAASDDVPALEHAWSRLVARAARRIRQNRARSAFVIGAVSSVPLATLSFVFAALGAPSAFSIIAFFAAVAAPALGWLIGRFRPLAPALVHARIDRQFGLADEALAARELVDRTSPAWRAAIVRQAVAHTATADWTTAWPLHWPRRTGLATGAALLAALLALFLLPRPAPAGPSAGDTLRAEQHAALSELAKDWEKTADDKKGEEWNAFRQTVADLRAKLAEPDLSERELLVALARVESRLAEASKSLADAGVSNHSEELSEALAGIEGMEKAAKALKEKNLSAAAAALDKAAAALSEKDAKVAFKDGASAEKTAQKLAQLSEKAAKKGDARLAESAKKMAAAAKASDKQSLGQCSSSLAEQSREAAASESTRASLASVARSLSEARSALAEGRKPGDKAGDAEFANAGDGPGKPAGSMPGGSGQRQQPGDNSAGQGVGDHGPGAENALAATARQDRRPPQRFADPAIDGVVDRLAGCRGRRAYFNRTSADAVRNRGQRTMPG